MRLAIHQVDVHSNIDKRRQKPARTYFQVLARGIRIYTAHNNIRLAERIGRQLPLDSIRMDLCIGINAKKMSARNLHFPCPRLHVRCSSTNESVEITQLNSVRIKKQHATNPYMRELLGHMR